MKDSIILLVYILIFYISSSQGQPRDSVTAGSIITNTSLTRLDQTIEQFSDSLNYLVPESDLPIFLSNKLFDFNMLYLMQQESENIRYFSARKLIFNRVFNVGVLERIIKSGNKNYDKIYDPTLLIRERDKSKPNNGLTHDYVNVPYQNMSVRGLARLRIRELSYKRPIKLKR